MEYRKLGQTGVDVSAIVLGAWQYGQAYWKGIDDSESVATIRAALDAGINMIDTAVGYGDGHSESVVARGVGDRRGEVLFASKCWGDPTTIPQTIDDCLKRMGTDCIDLYQVHYPSPRYPICETIGAMTEIQKAGKIRWIGVSNFSLRQMQEAAATARIETCQPPFNVFWRQIDDDVLPFCRENGISILAYSPLAQGLLAGRFRSGADVPDDIRAQSKLLAPDILERCLPTIDRLAEIAAAHGKTLPQAALAWALAVPGITCTIVGARRPSQLAENLGGVGWSLTPAEHEGISRAGLEVSRLLDFSSNMWGWSPAT